MIKRGDADIDAALAILKSEFIDINKTTVLAEGNPESSLLQKEMFRTLSPEVKELVALISDAPERIYTKNRISFKPREFTNYIKRRKGWSSSKIKDLKFELWFFLKAPCFAGDWRDYNGKEESGTISEKIYSRSKGRHFEKFPQVA